MYQPEFIIGIDLGTTNSIVAYTEAAVPDEGPPQIRILDIPQIVGNGVVENRNILPSFIFQPAAHEISDGRIALPWDDANARIVGEYARQRGAEVPQR